MDKKIKAKWVKALRSGDYKQGASALKSILAKGEPDFFNHNKAAKEDTTVFCCLGVLCDIAGGALHNGAEYPSDRFSKKVGLPYKMQKKLAEMNDGGVSFKKIATYIEKEMDAEFAENDRLLLLEKKFIGETD